MLLNKEIQAFYQCNLAQPDEYKSLRYDILTTIVYSHVSVDSNGNLVPTRAYNPAPLIQYTHSQGYGTKVVLMFNSTDTNAGDTILANATVRTNAINNLLNEVKDKNFDGIDIDVEHLTWGTNPINGQSNKQLMTNFVTTISNTFRMSNPNYRISLDIGIDTDVALVFDVAILQNLVDYMMIMGYDWYSWSSYAISNAPITTNPGEGSIHAGTGILYWLQQYEGLVNKNKLILGVPWYGYEFPTISNARLANKNGSAIEIEYDGYADIVSSYGRIWDSVWQTPWYARQVGSQWYQGHYDDVQSLGIKYDLVNSEGIGGIGIWAVTLGTNRSELWQLIQDKFGSSVPIPLTCTIDCPIYIIQGNSGILNMIPFGGISPYSYDWDINRPDGLVDNYNSQSIFYPFLLDGIYTISCAVSDYRSSGIQTCTKTCSVIVCKPISSCKTTCPSRDISRGNSFGLTVTWAGGKSPYSLQIFRDGGSYGSPVSSITNNTVITVNTDKSWSPGSHNISVKIGSCSGSVTCMSNICTVKIKR